MTPAQIVALCRDQSGTTTAQIGDPQMYVYLNHVYNDFWYKIVNSDNNFGRWRRTADLVADQNQYTLAESSPWVFWQLKVERLSIKYRDSQQTYFVAPSRDRDTMTQSDDRSQKYRQEIDAFYIISARSVFLYPCPKFDIVDGLILEGSKKPYDLTSSMTSADILVPEDVREVMSLGMMPYVYRARQQFDLVNQSTAEYNASVKESINNMSPRNTWLIKGITNTFNRYTEPWFINSRW